VERIRSGRLGAEMMKRELAITATCANAYMEGMFLYQG
jgi:hypothetical protein